MTIVYKFYSSHCLSFTRSSLKQYNNFAKKSFWKNWYSEGEPWSHSFAESPNVVSAEPSECRRKGNEREITSRVQLFNFSFRLISHTIFCILDGENTSEALLKQQKAMYILQWKLDTLIQFSFSLITLRPVNLYNPITIILTYHKFISTVLVEITHEISTTIRNSTSNGIFTSVENDTVGKPMIMLHLSISANSSKLIF